MGWFTGSSRGALSTPAATVPGDTLVAHLVKSHGPTADESLIREMLDELADAGGDPEAIAAVFNRHGAKLDDGLEALVSRVMRKGGVPGDVAWLPVQTLIKRGKNGATEGFKGPPELDRAYKRWAQRVTNGEIDGVTTPTPEEFITSLRNAVLLRPKSEAPFDGLLAFTDAAINHRYLDYVAYHAKKPVGALSKTDLEAFPVESYKAATVQGGRPRMMLDALFGPATRTDVAQMPANSNQNWMAFFPRVVKAAPPNSTAPLVALGKDVSALNQAVETLFRERFRHAAAEDVAEAQAFVRAALARQCDKMLPEGSVVEVLEDGARRIGQRGADGTITWSPQVSQADFLATHFNANALKKITGDKLIEGGLHPDEFVHRLLDAEDVLHNAMKSADGHLDAATRSRLGEEFGYVGGIYDLVTKVVTRSGHGKGYVFELELLVDEFTELARRKALPSGHPEHLPAGTRLEIQYRPDAAEGPDMIYLVPQPDGRPMLAYIRQAKSHNQVTALSGYWGSAIKQTGSDIRRFFSAATETAPNGWPIVRLENGETMELASTFRFYLDEGRLREMVPMPDDPAKFRQYFGQPDEIAAWLRQRNPGVDIGEYPFKGFDVPPTWLREAIDKADSEFAEINSFLRMRETEAFRLVNDQPVLSAEMQRILSKSARQVAGDTPMAGSSLDAQLIAHMSAYLRANPDAPPLTVAQAMTLRMMADPTKGKVDGDLVALAVRVGSLDPPPQIEYQFRSLDGHVPTGTDWSMHHRIAQSLAAAESADALAEAAQKAKFDAVAN